LFVLIALIPILVLGDLLVWTGKPMPANYECKGGSPQLQPKNVRERNRFLMTITKPFEVVGCIRKRTGLPARYAHITVRVEPGEPSEFVNVAKVTGFGQCFVEAAFSGIRSVSEGYSWLTFRFVITDARVHPVESSELAFHMAGANAAKAIFTQIYKKLTITADDPRTRIFVIDTEGYLVQAEVGRMETTLLQGSYDVRFGDAPPLIRVHLDDDVELHERM
jgi:hypothetical protein